MLSQLKDPETFRSKIFYNYIKMIKTRKRQSAFHPNADFEILEIDPKAFVIARYDKAQIISAVTQYFIKTDSEFIIGCKGASLDERPDYRREFLYRCIKIESLSIFMA